MKTLGKLIIVLVGLFVSVQAMAQSGTNPYEGSTHTYTIDKGMTNSDLAWSVTNGAAGDFDFIDGSGSVTTAPQTGTSVNIRWNVAKATAYNLQVTETRNAASGFTGCPVTRQIPVTVIANAFDVYADVITATEACASVTNPVVDNDTAGDGTDLGNNSDDVFGLTSREFLVTAVGATGDWDFTYTLTHKSAGVDESIGDLAVKIGTTDISATGQTVSVGSGITTNTITVSYTTNADRQDGDFDFVLTITGATDSLGTSDGDVTVGKTNGATYTVYAVPATTGITTD
ncbi:hypothetical protein [Labilibaculum antarcticum]|uniref:Uncharacterized protein n=1 Tax=Labilibaculum antarcticum TaxID=1717717 RepID=A0A1Y1CN55_9BACT|nr:hypothetical protein [Labilibaculum antarcticum]BAX80691.1 hypothetical protein ALGA_2364 [Labilibaculum antarcticum]